MSEIISRAEAKARGLKLYFTGVPCIHGHVSERRVDSCGCVECQNVISAAWAVKYPDRVRAKSREWGYRHPDKKRAYATTWNAANRGKKIALSAAWVKANPGKARAMWAKRRSMKFHQRCTCCTDAQIAVLYLAAKPWGKHAEVDHRIPLRLGGRHCVKNLVLLPAAAHREKTNRDMRAIADMRQRSKLLRRWRAA